jgi:hypothetical protein
MATGGRKTVLMQSSVRVILVLVMLAILAPAIAGACPLCKDAKANTDYPGGSASLPKGFYYSILLMVSAPFLVMGGLLFKIHLARRRLRSFPPPAPETLEEKPIPPLLPDARGARS